MANRPLSFDPARTALVLIDLQRGIIARQAEPHPTASVIANSAKLVTTLRPKGVLVVRVRVSFGPGHAKAPRADVDQPNDLSKLPAGWDELTDEVPLDPADVVVTKHQWGAFYGTDLDLVLRRRGRDTIILGGVATNIGVESTARDAWERNYRLLLVEDAMSSFAVAAHEMSVKTIFPRIGHVCSTADVQAAV